MRRLLRVTVATLLLEAVSLTAALGTEYPVKDLTSFVPFDMAPHTWIPHDLIAYNRQGDAGYHLFLLAHGATPPDQLLAGSTLQGYSTKGLSWLMGGGLQDGTYIWTQGKRLINPARPDEGYRRHTSYRSSRAGVQRAIDTVEPTLNNRICVLSWCNSVRTGVAPKGPHIALGGALNYPHRYPKARLLIPGLRADGRAIPIRLSRVELRGVLTQGASFLKHLDLPTFHDDHLSFDAVSGEWHSDVPASHLPEFHPPPKPKPRRSGVMAAADMLGLGAAFAHAYDQGGAAGVGGQVLATGGAIGATLATRAAGDAILRRAGTRLAAKAAGQVVKRFIPGVGWVLTAKDTYDGLATYYSNDVIKYEERIASDPLWWLTYKVVYGLGLY